MLHRQIRTSKNVWYNVAVHCIAIRCTQNTVCLVEEEYECLRSMFLDEDKYMGKQFSTWKNRCMIKDPPPWKELLAAPCSGSCGHFLVVVGVCSWLGVLKVALMEHGVPNPNRLYEHIQQCYDSYFLCPKPTLAKRSSQIRFTSAEQKGVNFLFLCHEYKDTFRVSLSPPDIKSQETLTALYQGIGTDYDMSREAHEQRILTSAREAAVPLVKRRTECAGYCSEAELGVCSDGGGEGVVATSDLEAVTEEVDLWQVGEQSYCNIHTHCTVTPVILTGSTIQICKPCLFWCVVLLIDVAAHLHECRVSMRSCPRQWHTSHNS